MNKTTMATMTSSVNEHWNTGPEILNPIRIRFGNIALDPCSNPSSIVGAQVAYDGVHVDGLKASWQCGGLVFANTPYGKVIRSWSKKIAAEAAAAKKLDMGTEIIFLGPARTDTKFFQEDVCPNADKVLLWKGRLKFLGAPAPAPFPSFLAYYGHRPADFMMAFIGKGWFM
jgi:DNA N-6-adenine-methyltransferase (Dam)